MELVFSEKNWGVLMVISLLIAAGVTLLLYYRNRDTFELTRWQKRILAILRFTAIFLIAFLLTGPLLKTLKKIIREPVIILGIDNSASIAALDPEGKPDPDRTTLIQSMMSSLSRSYDVAQYTFGEKVRRNNTPDFMEKRSDYGDFIETVYNNHFNDNVGAMAIIGDGIYNQGENPLNVARKLNYPVYTLAVGDTTASRDIRISAVRANRNAFAGNKFPVEIDIQHQGMRNEIVHFSIIHEGTLVYSIHIPLKESYGFQTITLQIDAGNKGLKHFTARVESSLEEKNKANNVQPFVINVLENKQRILLISGGAHPDAGALRDALGKQINYDISLVTGEPFPSNIRDYNLVVLFQLPSMRQPARQLIEEAERNRIPVLYAIGSQSHIPQFNLLGLGAGINLQAGSMEEAQAIVNKDFTSFILSDKLINALEQFPPLKVMFGGYQLDATWQVIVSQRIRNIDTGRPLIAVSGKAGIKRGIIFGEGIWRWRMYNYLLNDSHEEFNELMDKLVQYLALRDNEDNFIITCKPVFSETESVIMTAEVYNDMYEPVGDREIRLILRDSTRREFSYVFDRLDQTYRLDAGLFLPGNYDYEGTVELGGQTFSETGSFAVLPVNIERMEHQANHRMLYQLSSQSGGDFFLPADSEALAQSILANTKIQPFAYFQSLLNELLNQKWIFFVILIFLGVEWFLRKFWGIY